MKFVKWLLFYLAIAFAFIEIGLRIYDPFGFEYFTEAAKYKHYFLIPDSLTFYQHRPNTKAIVMNVPIVTNAIGAVSHGENKSPSLMVLGDSMVLSWGVPYNSSYMALIGADLAMGVGSWNSENEVDWLLRSKIVPKTLIWVIVPNDVISKSGFEECYEPKCFFYRYSILMTIKQYVGKNLYEHKEYVYDVSWQLAVKRMADFCHFRKIRLVPVYYWFNEDNIFKFYKADLAQGGYKLRRFPNAIYPNCFSKMDKHPNAKGHRMMAEYLRTIL